MSLLPECRQRFGIDKFEPKQEFAELAITRVQLLGSEWERANGFDGCSGFRQISEFAPIPFPHFGKLPFDLGTALADAHPLLA